ncbi:Transcriptional regulatory protein sin3 [Thoreauomyces humboldtii]|nr:Transcriptional regulatory protein sin3 [Thoreauomyces humboldtii]
MHMSVPQQPSQQQPQHPHPQQQQQQQQSSSQGPTLPAIQQPDFQSAGIQSSHYPYGGGAPQSSTYSNSMATGDPAPAPRMGLSHHPAGSDVPSGAAALSQPPVSQAVGAPAPQTQMPGTLSSTASNGAELTSAESQVIGASQGYRPLNVKDALSYLDQVKIRFNDQPEVYNRFLDIMKDFKSQALDTPGVIRRVSNLFREHPELISGFNTFLPPGYKIEPGANGEVKVTTPRDAPPYHDSSSGLQSLGEGATSVSNGTAILGNSAPPPYFGGSGSVYGAPSMSSHSIPPMSSHASAGPMNGASQPYNAAITSASNIISSMQSHGAPAAQPQGARKGSAEGENRRAPVEFNHAINYVNKIKNRFSSEPETYKQFLEILQTYQKEQKPIQEMFKVYAQVQVLFKGAPDLLDEFKQFLPDNSNNNNGQNSNPLAAFGRAGGLPVLSTINGMAVPVQPTPAAKPVAQTSGAASKKQQKRPAPSTSQASGGNSSTAQVPLPPPKKKAKTGRTEKPGTIEELEFFDKCKKIINNKTTYNEFLKILNLFSQEIIEAKILVERVEPFLSRAPDLFEWFKRFVKYEDDEVIYNIPAERPEINVNTLRRLGHSYRQLPAEIPRPKCSGLYVSETGFVSHKKTQFEEALHKCEEERYEFDMNIESNLHTIALLEPIARKIQGMNAEEKSRLKYPNGLGASKAIYQRVIKKIYDKERGAEIIDALHYSPAVAIPVVLKRLKQKDEEWKRSQRDWNKVWRDIHSKNYYKALDHQGINFKATDKKIMSAKSLMNEIEAIHGEQRDKRSGVTNRYQFDFSFKDLEVFKDVRALLRLQAQSSPDTDKKVLKILGLFTRRFFQLELDDEESEDDEGSDMEVEDDHVLQERGRMRARQNLQRAVFNRGAANGRLDSGDEPMDTDDDPEEGSLRDDGSTNGRIAQTGDEDKEMMDVDIQNVSGDSDNGEERRGTYVLYSNNVLYVFLRQFQMLYSRLLKMKELSAKIAQDPVRTDNKSHIAKELGLQKESLATYAHVDRYAELLQACYSFVTGDMESSEFEEKSRTMFGTSAYLIFTVDKLCQTIVKQVAVTDSKTMELMDLYYKDMAKSMTSARQEAMYRINVESIIQDDNIYRIEYFIDEKLMTVQLLSKEEHISDGAVSLEDRWSLYVDHFVQLHATENLRAFRREPFLKRNLPTTAPDEPPHHVEAHSGLELKVCVNTYKMFFVDHTEDYFTKKQPAEGGAPDSSVAAGDFSLLTPAQAFAETVRKRSDKFRSWLESDRGWKRGMASVDAERLNKEFDTWMKGSGGPHLDKQTAGGVARWASTLHDATRPAVAGSLSPVALDDPVSQTDDVTAAPALTPGGATPGPSAMEGVETAAEGGQEPENPSASTARPILTPPADEPVTGLLDYAEAAGGPPA